MEKKEKKSSEVPSTCDLFASDIGKADVRETIQVKANCKLILLNNRVQAYPHPLAIREYKCPFRNTICITHWSEEVKYSSTIMKGLKHANIVSVYNNHFNRNHTLFGVLIEDAGLPLSRLKLDLSPVLCQRFLQQTLDAFAMVEMAGYSVLSATMDSIVYHSASQTFKLSDTLHEAIIPRWIPVNCYDAYKKTPPEYASPELLFYATDCDPSVLQRKPCVTNDVADLDLRHQDVYSWGMILHRLVTGEACTATQKSDPNRYQEFLITINHIHIHGDDKDEIGKVVRPFLRAVLSLEPHNRPSFYVLKKTLNAAQKLPEEMIEKMLKSVCKRCGHVSKKEAAKCGMCEKIAMCIAPMPTEEEQNGLQNLVKKNPQSFIRFITAKDAVLEFDRANDAPRYLDLIKQCHPRRQATLLVEGIISVIQHRIAKQWFHDMRVLLRFLICQETDLLITDNIVFAQLYAHLVSTLLPIPRHIMPDFFTFSRTKSMSQRVPNNSLIIGECNNMITRGFQLLHQCKHHGYTKAWLLLLRRLLDIIQEPYADRAELLDEIKLQLEDIEDTTTGIYQFGALVLNEQLLQLAVLYKENDFAWACAKNISALATKFYTTADVKAFLRLIRGWLVSIKEYDTDTKDALVAFLSSPRREGNHVSELLANYPPFLLPPSLALWLLHIVLALVSDCFQFVFVLCLCNPAQYASVAHDRK